MTPPSATASRWTQRLRPVAAPRLRLFLLPYAGGGPQVFSAWAAHLPGDIDVHAVNLPGRGRRFNEPPFERLDPLVTALAEGLVPWLDAPFALYGHSLGAYVAFELARRLDAHGAPGPAHLFVSGAGAPQIPDRHQFHRLPDDQFLAEVQRLNGIDPQVLANAELVALMLPMLRADFTVAETYVSSGGPTLACPLSVFGGDGDWLVPVEALEGWRMHTTGPCRIDVLPGDHFFLDSARQPLLAAINERLRDERRS